MGDGVGVGVGGLVGIMSLVVTPLTEGEVVGIGVVIGVD